MYLDTDPIIYQILIFSLIIALLCSLYFCVKFLFYNNKKYFNSWQFPMIMAIVFDLYILDK
jgi:hypothetical protein